MNKNFLLHNNEKFSLMLLVIILSEIGIGTVSYIHRGELKTYLDKGFNKTLQNYNINKEVWDMVQTEVISISK